MRSFLKIHVSMSSDDSIQNLHRCNAEHSKGVMAYCESNNDTAMHCLKLANELHTIAGFLALIKKIILVSDDLKIQ